MSAFTPERIAELRAMRYAEEAAVELPAALDEIERQAKEIERQAKEIERLKEAYAGCLNDRILGR